MYLDHVGQDTFYGLLASLRGRLFSDDDFAEIYCLDNGRDSVPPSLLATALLLQTYDKVSDAEAKARADFDIRWKVALGIEIEDRPFAKSTLQMFRTQLILHDQVREVFENSLRLARQSGYLKKRGMRVALDTTYILGRGAVKDTYPPKADWRTGSSNCCGSWRPWRKSPSGDGPKPRGDRRQLVLPVATTIFAGRYGVIIRYGGTVDYRPTNQAIEAETYGRQDTGNGSGQGWDERAFSAQVAEWPIAVAGETGASVAHPSRPLRRGVGG